MSDSLCNLNTGLMGRCAAGQPDAVPQAAVLVGILPTPEPSLLYTVRASTLSTHAGEVAFPGGKKEQSDVDSWDTALRESVEEVGLNTRGLRRIGQLDRTMSRFGIEVTPCIAILPDRQKWRLSSTETAGVFTMPIATLLHSPPSAMDEFRHEGGLVRLPRWRSEQGPEIWGLTARITADFLCKAYGDNRTLCEPAIEP